MDEIYYIVGIDARPWQTPPKIGAAIPCALFFASIVAFRKALNESSAVLPDNKNYAATVFLVLIGMLLTRCLRQPWREEYSKNVLLNLVYLALISVGFFDALAQFKPINGLLVSGENAIMRCVHSNALRNAAIAMIICALGLSYVWLQTWLRSRADAKRLANRPSAHIFFHFHARESRLLKLIYATYFVGAVSLVSFLATDFSQPIFQESLGCR